MFTLFQYSSTRGLFTSFDTKYVSLKIFRNTVLLYLQYRQRAIQREIGTGISFFSLNQVVLLSVSDLETIAICCDRLSVVIVIVTNLADLWIYSPLYLHVFSGNDLLEKSQNFYLHFTVDGAAISTCLFEPCEVVAVVRSRKVTSS